MSRLIRDIQGELDPFEHLDLSTFRDGAEG
jgi:hypothetical protein